MAKGDPTSSACLPAGLPDRMAEHPTRDYASPSFFSPFIIPDVQYQANFFSFTFRRVERTWPIFIAANQARSAPAALRKIAEAFLSPRLFIIHQTGFHLPPSILCVFFYLNYGFLFMLRFYLRIKKEDTERKNRRKGKEGY